MFFDAINVLAEEDKFQSGCSSPRTLPTVANLGNQRLPMHRPIAFHCIDVILSLSMICISVALLPLQISPWVIDGQCQKSDP